jgi:antitoxin MazE
MQTALRKMGNSTGIILPRAILGQIGLTTGATLDLSVEDGRLIATPVKSVGREHWAEAAVSLTEQPNDTEAALWHGFANQDDDSLTW